MFSRWVCCTGLAYTNVQKIFAYLCMGATLDENYIVTAVDSITLVYFGKINWSRNKKFNTIYLTSCILIL